MLKQKNRGAFRFDRDFVDDLIILGGIASQQSNISFQAKAGVMTVAFFGEEVQARKRFSISETADFDFSAKAAEIAGPMKNFGEGVITVYDNHIRINSGGTNMARQISAGLPICEFPDFTGRDFHELPNDIFAMASFASYAVSKSNLGKAQERTSIKLRDGEVSIYALDGYRGVMVDGPTGYQGSEAEYLFNPDLMVGLAALIKKNGGIKVFVTDMGCKYLLKVGDIEITTRILACSESFRQSLDGAVNSMLGLPVMEVSLPAAEMVCYLERTKLVENGSERHRLELFADPNAKTVKAEFRAGIGELIEQFDAGFEKEQFKNFSIALNPKYLADACSRLYNSPFTAQFRGSDRPVLIREEHDGYRIAHLVLPVAQKQKAENMEETEVDFSSTREVVVVSKLIEETPAVSRIVTPSGEETGFTEEDLC